MTDFRHAGKEVDSFLHAHLQHVVDVFPFIGDLQGLLVVALPAALLARDINVGEKVHGNAQNAISLTCFTASALYVKGEASPVIAAHAGFRGLCIQLADIVKNAGIGRRVRTRRSPDRRLVNINNLINVLDTQNLIMRAGF